MDTNSIGFKQLRRRLSRQELDEAVALADLVFRDGEQSSMGDSFPRIFDPAIGLSLGITEEGQLVSFIGFVPQQIFIGQAVLSVCALGSVCTHPDYRGQGHASVLLNEAFHQAEAMGAALMLISGTRSLYRRNGCFAFGSVRRYRIPHKSNMPSGMTARKLEPSDWFRLQALANSKPAGYRRSIADLAQELHSEAVAAMYRFHHDVFVAEKNGQLEAYAVIASGPIPADSDLEPFIVEWGGKAAVALPLIQEAMTRMQLSSMLLFAASHERRMMKLLDGHPYTSSHNQGTVRIMNLPLLWEQLEPYFEAAAATAGRVMPSWGIKRLSDEEYALRLGDELIPLSSRAWALLLFDGPDAEPDDGPDAFVRKMALEQRAELLPTMAGTSSRSPAPSGHLPEMAGTSSSSASSTAKLTGSGIKADNRLLPFSESQAELLRDFFPLPFPYTAGLSYI
ncbi:GNAT family N-acetyltransferase [Paenibacillus herberti]|uniref:N-acetyltransferase domain-containing protein n=1 Tax=Paenibacillus herberti TaxID=1619309 RepID=A0A229NUG3_9BACL|nr:GNAT family N-acetyltransferase [Paenibacillus herberti]OXM13488.1 hypothetical protein CGZ75_20825 [Paenibacillus herberti]